MRSVPSSKTMVLVVEDHREAREMLCELLEHHGFRAIAAPDGAEAWEQIRSCPPDLVLMDLSLPRMSGWDLARRIREAPKSAGLPIVALTAHASPFALERARSAGCDRVFVKPLPHASLIAELRDIASASTGRSRLTG